MFLYRQKWKASKKQDGSGQQVDQQSEQDPECSSETQSASWVILIRMVKSHIQKKFTTPQSRIFKMAKGTSQGR